MSHDYGDSLSSGVNTKITTDYSEGVFTITHEIVCDWASRDSLTPSLGTTLSSGGKTYKLTKATQETLPGSLGKLTLVYSASSTDGDGVPSTTFNETTSQLEVDIREHPDFDDWSDDWDEDAGEFKPGTDKYGIKSYIKGSTQVVKTEYYSSLPSSPYASVGTLESPGGGYGGSGNWLIIGATRQKAGEFYTIETTYLYSATEWNSDVYS